MTHYNAVTGAENSQIKFIECRKFTSCNMFVVKTKKKKTFSHEKILNANNTFLKIWLNFLNIFNSRQDCACRYIWTYMYIWCCPRPPDPVLLVEVVLVVSCIHNKPKGLHHVCCTYTAGLQLGMNWSRRRTKQVFCPDSQNSCQQQKHGTNAEKKNNSNICQWLNRTDKQMYCKFTILLSTFFVYRKTKFLMNGLQEM